MRLGTKHLTVNLIFAAVLLFFTAWAVYSEVVTSRPWKKYQREFKQIELADTENRLKNLELEKLKTKDPESLKKIDRSIELLKLKLAKADASRPKISQNWLLEFNNEADRCVTCHMAADKQGFGDRPHPYKTHSGKHLEIHPVQTFGCINCHDGQGPALTVESAHGEVEHWLKPFLKGGLAQSSCGKCHFMDQRLPLDTMLPGAEQFVKGWKLYMDNNCLGCHKLSGYERPKRIGPVLTLIGKKVNREWIMKWIKDPKDYLPKTKMPNFLLKDDEIPHIASYLLSLSKSEKISEPASGEKLNNASAIKSGEGLVKKLGCIGCHTIKGKGGTFGPDLSDVRSKTTPAWLFYWLKDPKVYQPDSRMPNLRIPGEEIKDIVAYLNTLSKEKSETAKLQPLSPGDIEKGKKLVKDKGCTGCHEIEKFPLGFDAPEHNGIGSKRVDELVWSNVKDGEKTLSKWLQIKVREPRKFATDKIITRMPKFGFSEEDAKALVTFLMSLRKESLPQKYAKRLNDPATIEMKGRKFLEEKNCLGCHKVNKKGGDIAPDLTEEGKKVRPEWLFDFLNAPRRIRPMQDARMPYFKLSVDEADTVLRYLSLIAKEPYPYDFKPKRKTYVENIEKGKKLYHKELACLGCHTFEGKGGEVGPEHTDMASRLKREWVERWLKDPQAIQPDVRMPRFKFKDGEMEVLIDYLATMGKERFLTVQ